MKDDDILDRAHLSAYTDGDEALEREILGLFLTHAASYLAAMSRHGDVDTWRREAHRLKGAARAVGAVAVARCAEAAETAQVADRLRHCTNIDIELSRLRDAVTGRR